MAAMSHTSKPDTSSFLEPTKYESSLITCLGDPNKYLTRPMVYRNRHMVADHELLVPSPDEPDHHSDGAKNRVRDISGDEVNDKIQETLKLLNLRNARTLIQFWLPYSVGNRKLLKTVDQPFGLGIHDERLCNYRRESERSWFHVDEECKEEDLIPVVRVFRQQLPEWTSDVTNYYSKNHPLRDRAISWDLHGYLVLPVFDSLTMSCVGVLEFVTSSRYSDCAYEVQEVHRTLKEANLTSPQAFDCPTTSHAKFKNTQHELDDIFKILKECCFTHKLPFAQTWKVSTMSSFVATERNIEMSCNSFNSSCIGQVCLTTTGLPFYVHDLRFWPFREACREHHLLKSKGVVGRALSSHGSCFCADVTKLVEEYSLVHIARMSGLTSCLAIYLRSKKHDDSYVLEFFLPVDIKESVDLQNLVQKLKLHVKSSYFEFGDLLGTEVINGMPIEISQCDFGQVSPKNRNNAITSTDRIHADDLASKKIINVVTSEKGVVKQRRKRKTDPLTLENIQQYFGKPIGEASKRLCVSRSTLKRVCREFNIPSWPKPNYDKKNVSFGIYAVVFLLVRVKRWICSSNHHSFSPRWWICGKHNSFASRSTPSLGGEIIRRLLSSSQTLNEPDEYIETVTSFSKLPVAHFDKDYKHVGGQISDTFDAWHASESPKMNVQKLVSDKWRMVTVKATYKGDMIKLKFPISSGLLELEKQVAQRFKLKNTRIYLKYKDEDDDLILIACDADFHNLMSLSDSSVSNHTIKLIVHIAES